MSAPMKLDWPNLSLLVQDRVSLPVLDFRVAPFPAESLLKRAKGYKKTDPWISDFLTRIAKSKTALNALNDNRTAIRNGNIAIHYLAATKYLPIKKVKAPRGRVARLWKVKDSYVKEILTLYRGVASEWLDSFVAYVYSRTDFATHEQIVRAITLDFEHRASTMARKGE